MVVKASFLIRRPGSTSERVTAGARVVHMSGDDHHCVSVFRATTPTQLEELLDGSSHLLDGMLEKSDSWAVARCTCPRTGSRIIPLIRAAGCTILWPTIMHDGAKTMTLVAPTRQHVVDLLEKLKDVAEVTVGQVLDVGADSLEGSLPLSDISRRLTEKQMDALLLAVQNGYYESPRRIAGQDLAGLLGVSRSTFQEHLRKAEAGIVEVVATAWSRHPDLRRESRGLGRPRSS